MITKKPFSLTRVKRLKNGDLRFTVVVHTSLGLWYSHGFRLLKNGAVMPPSVKCGDGREYLVRLTPFMRAAIKQLLIIWMLRHEDRKPAPDCEVPGSALVHL